MKLFRYVVPVVGVVVLALGAASSSQARSASADDALALEMSTTAGSCKAVRGVEGTDVVCATRGRTVVGLRDEPRGRACPAGGLAVSWGADANANGQLDPSELEGSTFVCRRQSGSRGGTGQRGTRAMVATTPLAERDGHCPAGGALVQSGIDRDRDGVLSRGEVDRATFSCNRFGGPALVAFVDVAEEPPGPACAYGGKRIAVGHEGESARISYACHVR